jgi:hypothetical protein
MERETPTTTCEPAAKAGCSTEDIMTVSANSPLTTLAATLAAGKKGTFTSVIYQKKGIVRGGVRYEDDEVYDVIVTGFSYKSLVARSLDILTGANPDRVITDDDVLKICKAKGLKDKHGKTITRDAVRQARADLIHSLSKSERGVNKSTTDHVYEPLVVDGKPVRGARVYIGAGGPGPKDPVPGSVYLQGLRIGRKVLTAAANGRRPASKSRADVIAKGIFRSMLPVGRYVSYALEPGKSFFLAVGGTAAVAADTQGVTTDPAMVQAIRDLATQ